MCACLYSCHEGSQEGPNELEHLNKCWYVGVVWCLPGQHLYCSASITEMGQHSSSQQLPPLSEEDTFKAQGQEMLLHLLNARSLRYIKHQRQKSFFCSV